MKDLQHNQFGWKGKLQVEYYFYFLVSAEDMPGSRITYSRSEEDLIQRVPSDHESRLHGSGDPRQYNSRQLAGLDSRHLVSRRSVGRVTLPPSTLRYKLVLFTTNYNTLQLSFFLSYKAFESYPTLRLETIFLTWLQSKAYEMDNDCT